MQNTFIETWRIYQSMLQHQRYVRLSLTLWMHMQILWHCQRTVEVRIRSPSILETVSSFISNVGSCRENSLHCDYSYPFVHLTICLSVGVAMSSTNEYAAGEVIPSRSLREIWRTSSLYVGTYTPWYVDVVPKTCALLSAHVCTYRP